MVSHSIIIIIIIIIIDYGSDHTGPGRANIIKIYSRW